MSASPRLAAAALAAALGAALLPAPARAFVRSADDGCGSCFYWPQADRVVPFVVNGPGDADDGVLEASCGGTAAVDAVRAGFAAWSDQACTDLALAFAGGASTSKVVGYLRSGTNENLVVFRKGFCQDVVAASDPCWDTTEAGRTCDAVHNCFLLGSGVSRATIGLTTVTYNPSTGRILDADMELNGWDGLAASGLPVSGPPPAGWYFSCADPAPLDRCVQYGEAGCYSMDVQNTVTHEAGHFIGLAHPCEGPACGGADSETTMFPSASVGETKKRSLAADDVAGLCTVYPAGAASPSCPSTCAEEESGCGCGTASPSGAGAALLGLLALAPRLRRRRGQDTTTPA